MALEQLKHSCQQTLLVPRVLVDTPTEAIEDKVLLLGRVLQVSDERVKLRLVGKHSPGGHSRFISCLALLFR